MNLYSVQPGDAHTVAFNTIQLDLVFSSSPMNTLAMAHCQGKINNEGCKMGIDEMFLPPSSIGFYSNVRDV